MNKEKLSELLYILFLLFLLLIGLSLLLAGLSESYLITAISLIPALIVMIIVGVIINKQ